ncbi:Tn3 family transposase [Streptomyces sp. NEAU-H22]|uniref:Tn3 family transposase n=1 Tax=Streptomyces sp. NEAU-H22 TaxID=2994655 RepID=UPI003A598C10
MHGASVVGFAFTELLNFRLLPRLKNIGSIRPYRPDDTPPGWPALGASLSAAAGPRSSPQPRTTNSS